MEKINDIGEELKKRIEYELAHWNDLNSEARKRFENFRDYYNELTAPLEKAIEDSERLTQKDYNLVVNI